MVSGSGATRPASRRPARCRRPRPGGTPPAGGRRVRRSRQCAQLGCLRTASLGGQRAPRVEVAAGRRVQRAREVAAEHDPAAATLLGRVGHRCRGEQRLRVRVLRRGEQLGGRGLFDDPPQVHHRDAVRQVLHGREVVGDEQAAEAAVALEVREEVEDGRLHGHVERGGRLVGHQQVGGDRQRTGDRHPLALATGQLMGIAVRDLGPQTHLREELVHPARGLGAVRQTVQPQRLRDDLTYRHPGVEGGRGVLEDKVEVLPQGPQFTRRERGDVPAVDLHAATGRPVQAHHAPPHRRLAAARLPDEAHDLAGHDRQRHPVHRLHGAAGSVEVPLQVVHGQHRSAGARSAGARGAGGWDEAGAHRSVPLLAAARDGADPAAPAGW